MPEPGPTATTLPHPHAEPQEAHFICKISLHHPSFKCSFLLRPQPRRQNAAAKGGRQSGEQLPPWGACPSPARACRGLPPPVPPQQEPGAQLGGGFTNAATSRAVETATSSLRARGERWAGTRCPGRAAAFVPGGSQALLPTEQLPGSSHSSGQSISPLLTTVID